MSDSKAGTASTRAKNKWQANNCDRVNLVVPKGKKDKIRNFAQTQGKSLNGFINDAIDKAMESDNTKADGD